MYKATLIRAIRLGALLALVASFGLAQASKEWPMYGGDPGSMRYSELTQINAGNVATLGQAWTYHMSEEDSAAAAAPAPPAPTSSRRRRRPRSSEATPIMANGMLYLPTPYGTVVALEPESGKQVWSYQVERGLPAGRGVAFWPGDEDHPARIVFGTADGRLIALNASTGVQIADFGENGVVNMKEGVDNGYPNARYGLSSPPVVYKNLIITGGRVQESPGLGAAGDSRAWDVKTGKLVWQFHSVPRPGETGHDTWEGDSWKGRSGTNVWGFISVDPDLGMVYLPHGSPTSDFYGADRRGANLFGNSIVALDAETGKLSWYFQTVHHDTWDYDLSAAPVLFDVVRDGERIPALGQLTKQGLLFILDRRDGTPIFGVEERPVPATDVPGEQSWPTEPFPVKPEPLTRMGFSEEDIATVTPEQEQYCKELLATEGGMVYGGPFTRYGSKLSIVFPGTLGASNWHGGSVDPRLGYMFVNTLELADVGKVEEGEDGSYERVSPWGKYGRFWNGEKFWPCQQPPWARLLAINVNTGDVAWAVPFGKIEELEALGVHDTGAPNMGGTIATAGGLVFVGATNDEMFRAFDSKTGKVLWETKLEHGAYATPMTFEGKDGKQYVVIVATGGGYYDRIGGGDSVVAFALPDAN